MWFGKDVFKHVASSLAIALAVVVPSLAADVRPLHFNSPVSQDQDIQQSYWNYLMRFKIWGTEGVSLGSRVELTDKTGATGTATGDITVRGEKLSLGGPIVSGRDIRFDGNAKITKFTTGPTRVQGSMNASQYEGNEFHGTNCLNASNSITETGINNANGLLVPGNPLTGECDPKKVIEAKNDLSIPVLTGEHSYRSGLNVPTRETRYLDIPSGEGMYDLYMDYMHFGEENSALYVRMPAGGRLTRIFVKEMTQLFRRVTLKVVYVGEGSVYDYSSNTYTTVVDPKVQSNDDYAGNLLIYVPHDLTIQSDYAEIQGSFISTGKITAENQMKFAGQLIANEIYIGDQFDGNGFHFVPFDPAKPDPTRMGDLLEGESGAQNLNIYLTKKTDAKVEFKYCFLFDGDPEAGLAEGNIRANANDIVSGKGDFVLCGGADNKASYNTAVVNVGEQELADPISLYVNDDMIIENDESFSIFIFDMDGAVFNGDKREGTLPITIIDDDKKPVCFDTTLVMNEDDSLFFNFNMPAYQHDSVTPLTVDYIVPIIETPVQGLTIYGETVLADGVKYRPIPKGILKDTRYQPALNEYGTHYDSLVYAIEVGAKENRHGVRSESCKIYIDVKPVNDAPVLNDTTITIRENTPVDSILLQLVGTDVENDKLTYGVVAGEGDSHFNLIGAVKDSLVLVSALDYETQKEHKIRVYVTDGELNDSAYVTIKLIDENEKPKFDEDKYDLVAVEHSKRDSLLETISASDVDAADQGKITYSYKFITPAVDDSAFYLLSSGVISTRNPDSLNYEKLDKYELWAYATDVDGLYDSVKVTITVVDINEDPAFEQDKFYYQTNFVSIPENAAAGEILTFNFSDPDFKSVLDKSGYHQLQLKLLDCTEKDCKLGSADEVDANVSSMFSIKMNSDSTSGVLSLTSTGASKLNYEADSTYNMLIEVRDNAKVPALSLADTIVIRVRITNVNEPPHFDETEYSFSVKEHQVDIVKVGEVHATDVDFKTTLSYSFAEGALTDASGKFSIDAKTGAISTKVSLDYEVDSVYTMMAYVTDNDATKPLKDSVPVTIKVIDINETPWAEGIDCTVPENSTAGTALELYGDDVSGNCVVVGQDPDKYNKNFNQLTYTWDDPSEEGADLFAINKTTGAVTVAKSKALDYETKKSYSLTVKIADNGDPSLDSTAVVNIRIGNVNEPPVLADTTITISEKTAVNKTVLQWKAVDPEVGNQTSGLTYSILSQNIIKDGVEIPTDDFKSSTTKAEGVLKVKYALDYDTKPEYILKVVVVDAGGLKDTATVKVIVTDVNEPPYFDDDEFWFSINEHNPENAFVDSLIAFDDDADEKYNQLHFSLLDDPSGFFAVSEDGVITVPEKNVLNYESVDEKDVPPTYDVTVVVSDGYLYDTAVVHIEIGDINESPVLKAETFEVKEHKKQGEFVGKVVATDPDFGDNENLTYKLVGSSSEFAVDIEGNITTRKELNFESITKPYTIKVQVSDDGTPNDSVLTATATITIKVIDVNETPYVGDQEFTISELATKDTLIGSVTGASDKDILNDYFSDLIYEISDTIVGGVETKGSDFFTINKSTGKISVKSGVTFDYETKGKVYYLKLTVTDHADPSKEDKPLSATSLITINIEDVPEPPKFPQDDYEFDVLENALEGTVVGELSADDKDENERLVYELKNLDGSVSSQFKVSYADNKAVIKVEENAGLDHETLAHYEVLVIVTDKSNLRDTAKVIITVNDDNETPTLEEQYFELYENRGADYKLDGIVEAGDLDTAAVFTKHYFEAVGGDTALFTMNKRGEIFANFDMDYEEYKKNGKTTFVLKTKVTDSNGDSLSVIKNMYIDLLNENEDPYVTTDTLEVAENSKGGTLVGMLDAEDPDGPTTFTFNLSRASDEFGVEADGSVLVKTGAILDYETKNEYKIYVDVTDAEGATSSVKPVIIKILDVNEAPVLNDTILYVSEAAAVDTIFGKVVGYDPDKFNDAFNQLTYEMVSVKDTFDFLEDGSAKLLRGLDYEAIPSYVRQVRIYDGEFYDTANVVIKVINVVESTIVEIIQVDDPDSLWKKPDTIYTNVPEKHITWLEDGKKYESDTTLVDGPNVIERCFWDRTKDYEGCDTVVIYYSSSTPVVKVYAEKAKVSAENVYTIVEETDKSDTTIYVNNPEKEITVSILDTASGVNKKFTVDLELDTAVTVPEKTMKNINNIAAEKITLRDGSDVETTKFKVTGKDQVIVSYMDTVTINGEKFPVKISYNTNNKGEETKTEVVGEDGEVEKIQVITVSYTTTINGKEVEVSYQADAITGEVLNMTSGGKLTKAEAGSSSGMAQDAVGTYAVSYSYKDKGNAVDVRYVIDDEGNFVKNEDGDIGYEVSYTYVNKFGNSATKSVFVVLDQVGPKVEILNPTKSKKIEVVSSNFINVKWTVNGIEQDTLITQGLEKGLNAIVRFYRDKAGNESSDTVFIIMKNSKTIEIAVEQPVTEVTREKVEEYYAENPPKEGQTYSVSIMNPTTGAEKETLVGGKGKPKEGSGETPYPNVDSPYHLGPTLALDIKLPVVKQTDEDAKMDGINTGVISGLATLDDLMNSEGRIPLDGVDANNGEKPTVEEFVKEYCEDGFEIGSDPSKVTLYDTKMDVKIWVYTTLGGFVNYYHFAQDLNEPDYTNEAGMVKMFFEMKPNKDGDVTTDDGRLLASGSYVYKVEVKLRSKLKCSLPPVNDGASPKKGDVIKNDDQLLKTFGYKRPRDK
ncbi:MAG: cadherin repeat domain-containing protein [Fibrobacter sp.]|nr:cadherin repeat domain-containing protein [Fibrobacter sp.]